MSELKLEDWPSLALLSTLFAPFLFIWVIQAVFRVTKKGFISVSRVSFPPAFPKWILNSRFYSNLCFAWDAPAVIRKGYEQWSDRVHKIIRSDGDVIVLPASNVVELSNLPHAVADGTRALEHDLVGSFTGLDFILGSDLHYRVVQRRITPNLGSLLPHLQEEIDLAVNDLWPKEKDGNWTTVYLYYLVLATTARTSARAFVGKPFCRDKDWLYVAVNFVEDMFRTIVVLRTFPTWAYRFVCYLIPSFWRGKIYFNKAVSVLGKEVQARLQSRHVEGKPSPPKEEQTGLDWLVDMAAGNERSPRHIAYSETVLALAGIHTLLLRQLSVIYDLTANPEYLSEILEEIKEVGRETEGRWTKESYGKLRKLDSFMRESQRMAPPTTLGLKRMMRCDYTLSDGTFLPKGAYVCVASHAIENDPANTPDPETFDGFRSYRKPATQQGSNAHAFSATEPTVLGFGYGKSACPGRHFASLFIKMSIVKLLSDFEFEYLPGRGRPKNWVAHEFLFAPPWAKIRVRRRADTAVQH